MKNLIKKAKEDYQKRLDGKDYEYETDVEKMLFFETSLRDMAEATAEEMQSVIENSTIEYGKDADRRSAEYREGVEQGITDSIRHNCIIINDFICSLKESLSQSNLSRFLGKNL